MLYKLDRKDVLYKLDKIDRLDRLDRVDGCEALRISPQRNGNDANEVVALGLSPGW